MRLSWDQDLACNTKYKHISAFNLQPQFISSIRLCKALCIAQGWRKKLQYVKAKSIGSTASSLFILVFCTWLLSAQQKYYHPSSVVIIHFWIFISGNISTNILIWWCQEEVEINTYIPMRVKGRGKLTSAVIQFAPINTFKSIKLYCQTWNWSLGLLETSWTNRDWNDKVSSSTLLIWRSSWNSSFVNS